MRVGIAESAPPSLAFDSAAEDQASTALPASQTLAVLAIPVQWSEAFKPCALAALVASLLMALGLDPFVTMLSVGFLAVVFYRQRRLGSTIKPATGWRVGAASGFLGVCHYGTADGAGIHGIGLQDEVSGKENGECAELGCITLWRPAN